MIPDTLHRVGSSVITLRDDLIYDTFALRTSTKNFLQSLYFGLQWEKASEALLDPLNQTLCKISAFSPSQNQ